MINYIKNLSSTTKTVLGMAAAALTGAGVFKLVQHYTDDEEIVQLKKKIKEEKKSKKK